MDSLAHNIHPTRRGWQQPLGTSRSAFRVSPGLLPNSEREWHSDEFSPDIDPITGKMVGSTSTFGASIRKAESRQLHSELPAPTWRSLGVFQRQQPGKPSQLAMRSEMLSSLTASHRSSGRDALQFDASDTSMPAGIDLRRAEARLGAPAAQTEGLPPPHMRSSVDEIVFGHDMDRSTECGPSLELPARPMFRVWPQQTLSAADSGRFTLPSGRSFSSKDLRKYDRRITMTFDYPMRKPAL